MPFVKGDPNCYRKGRPQGSKDKKWASLDYWFGLVETVWDKLEPKDQAHIGIDAWKALLSRNKAALTPEESVQNVESSMRLLKMLQEVARNGGNTRAVQPSGQVGMGDGRSTAQTPPPPVQGI